MARKGRAWTPVDIESVKELQKLRAKDSRELSLRAIGSATGISHGRIGDLFNFTNGAPSLYEFTSLCLLFGERPSRVMERVMQTIEQNERTTNTTTALADMDPDQLADLVAADPDAYDIAALRDPYKDLERETPRA